MMKLSLIFSVLFSVHAFTSEGGGHHGSPGDLIFPAINFLILAAFFIWKLRPMFRNIFQKKHTNIKESIEKAKTLKFEAQMNLEQQEKKNANLSSTLHEIEDRAEKDIQVYKEHVEKDTMERIAKLKEDAELKVENQKSEFLSKINNELINEIIDGAKSKIKSEKNLKNNIESKLIERIQ
ncbi:MAG: hypothetical protein H6621_06840 [Halobacteriovoraceae bacterium]|nr:hypothetical protein [Halobacteriovoraceae bacterium]